MQGMMGLLWKYGRGIFFLILAVYFTAMVMLPIYEGGNKWWSHTQNVWSRWQTLNAAMIALTSSIVALNIAQFVSSEQRKRKFKANLAFLPQELSILTKYCKDSMDQGTVYFFIFSPQNQGAGIDGVRGFNRVRVN